MLLTSFCIINFQVDRGWGGRSEFAVKKKKEKETSVFGI
jgi:hypothetical protein